MAMVENFLRTCLIVKDTITINSVKLLAHPHQRKHHVIQKDMTSRWGEKVSVSGKSSMKSLDMTSG
jgi:putative SOS response-associated peptidase YedK